MKISLKKKRLTIYCKARENEMEKFAEEWKSKVVNDIAGGSEEEKVLRRIDDSQKKDGDGKMF